MTLRGSICAGTISGVIDLNGQLTGHYVAESEPKIVIGRSALPDTVLDSIGKWAGRSHRGRRLGHIIDHPFITAYDPPIARVANVNGAVEIAL